MLDYTIQSMVTSQMEGWMPWLLHIFQSLYETPSLNPGSAPKYLAYLSTKYSASSDILCSK